MQETGVEAPGVSNCLLLHFVGLPCDIADNKLALNRVLHNLGFFTGHTRIGTNSFQLIIRCDSAISLAKRGEPHGISIRRKSKSDGLSFSSSREYSFGEHRLVWLPNSLTASRVLKSAVPTPHKLCLLVVRSKVSHIKSPAAAIAGLLVYHWGLQRHFLCADHT